MNLQTVNNLLSFLNRVPVTGTDEAMALVSCAAELTAIKTVMTSVPAVVPPAPAAQRVPAQSEAPQTGDPIPPAEPAAA